MATSTETYTEMKSVFKEALVELMEEQRDYFRDIIKELLDEKELAQQAKQSQQTVAIPTTDSDELFEKQVQAEVEGYHRLHPILWEKYPGQHVAIFKQELIDYDQDFTALYQRIDKQYPNEFVLLRQVEQEPERERELHMRSPRLILEKARVYHLSITPAIFQHCPQSP